MSEWRDVKGYEGLYKVSDDGEIKHVNRKKPITPVMNGNYMRVTLSRDGKLTTKYLHRIVAEAFIPNKDNLPIVYHKDKNRRNNKASNLEWSEKKGITVLCKWCGKELEVTMHNRVYCSAECRLSAKAKRDAERSRQNKKPKAPKAPKSEYKPSRPKMIDNLEYCRNYADNQKAETLRLLREGLL